MTTKTLCEIMEKLYRNSTKGLRELRTLKHLFATAASINDFTTFSGRPSAFFSLLAPRLREVSSVLSRLITVTKMLYHSCWNPASRKRVAAGAHSSSIT